VNELENENKVLIANSKVKSVSTIELSNSKDEIQSLKTENEVNEKEI